MNAAQSHYDKMRADVEAIAQLVAPHPRVLVIAPPGSGVITASREVYRADGPFAEGSDEHVAAAWMHERLTDGRPCLDEMGQPLRPFRAPHYTVSAKGMIGTPMPITARAAYERIYTAVGGLPPLQDVWSLQTVRACALPPKPSKADEGEIVGYNVYPGEVCLAHGGTLLLDSVHEWSERTLEATLHALQMGHVDHTRDGGRWSVRLPAAPRRVIATTYPCACGWLGAGRPCTCSSAVRQAFEARAVAMRTRLRAVGFAVVEVST